MSGESTAAALLRADLDRALQRASKESGHALEWSEQELATLDRACKTADRAEVLRARFEAEQEAGGKPTELVKLSAELRLLDKQVIDLIVRVNPELGPAKSDRHQRAVKARWVGRSGA